MAAVAEIVEPASTMEHSSVKLDGVADEFPVELKKFEALQAMEEVVMKVGYMNGCNTEEPAPVTYEGNGSRTTEGESFSESPPPADVAVERYEAVKEALTYEKQPLKDVTETRADDVVVAGDPPENKNLLLIEDADQLNTKVKEDEYEVRDTTEPTIAEHSSLEQVDEKLDEEASDENPEESHLTEDVAKPELAHAAALETETEEVKEGDDAGTGNEVPEVETQPRSADIPLDDIDDAPVSDEVMETGIPTAEDDVQNTGQCSPDEPHVAESEEHESFRTLPSEEVPEAKVVDASEAPEVDGSKGIDDVSLVEGENIGNATENSAVENEVEDCEPENATEDSKPDAPIVEEVTEPADAVKEISSTEDQVYEAPSTAEQDTFDKSDETANPIAEDGDIITDQQCRPQTVLENADAAGLPEEDIDRTEGNVEKVLVEEVTAEKSEKEYTTVDSEKQEILEQGDVSLPNTKLEYAEEKAAAQDSDDAHKKSEAALEEGYISEQPSTEVMEAAEGTLEDKSELTASNVSREMDFSDSQHQDSVSGEEKKYEESRELEAQVFPAVSAEILDNKENDSAALAENTEEEKAIESLDLSSAAEVTKSEVAAQIEDDDADLITDQECRPNEVNDAELKEVLTRETDLPEAVLETTGAIGSTEEHDDDKENATDVNIESSLPADVLEQKCSEENEVKADGTDEEVTVQRDIGLMLEHDDKDNAAEDAKEAAVHSDVDIESSSPAEVTEEKCSEEKEVETALEKSDGELDEYNKPLEIAEEVTESNGTDEEVNVQHGINPAREEKCLEQEDRRTSEAPDTEDGTNMAEVKEKDGETIREVVPETEAGEFSAEIEDAHKQTISEEVSVSSEPEKKLDETTLVDASLEEKVLSEQADDGEGKVDESETLKEKLIDEFAESEEVPAPAPVEWTPVEDGDGTEANVEKVLVEEKQDSLEQGDSSIPKTEEVSAEEEEAATEDSDEAAPKEGCVSEQLSTDVTEAEEGTLEGKSELTASSVSREMDLSDSQHQDSVSGEEMKCEESRELEAQVFPRASSEIPENKENEIDALVEDTDEDKETENLELSSSAEVTKSGKTAREVVSETEVRELSAEIEDAHKQTSTEELSASSEPEKKFEETTLVNASPEEKVLGEEVDDEEGKVDESVALKDQVIDEVCNSEEIPASAPVLRETIEDGDSTEANVEKVLVEETTGERSEREYTAEDSEKHEILEQGDISISKAKLEYAEEEEAAVQDAPEDGHISEQPSTEVLEAEEGTLEDKSELTSSGVPREVHLSDSRRRDSVFGEETKYEQSRELEAQTEILDNAENESAALVDEEKANGNESRAVESLELSSAAEVTTSEEVAPTVDDADKITDRECQPNEVDGAELQEVPASETELAETVLQTTGAIRLTEQLDEKENTANEDATEATAHTGVDIEPSSPAEATEEKCSEEKEVERNAALVPEVEAGDSLRATSLVEDEANDLSSPDDTVEPETQERDIEQEAVLKAQVSESAEEVTDASEDQTPEAPVPKQVEETFPQPEECPVADDVNENTDRDITATDIETIEKTVATDDTEKADGSDEEVTVQHDINPEADIAPEAREEKWLDQEDTRTDEAPENEDVVNIQTHDETIADIHEEDSKTAREDIPETEAHEISAEIEDAPKQAIAEEVSVTSEPEKKYEETTLVNASLEERVSSEEVDDGEEKVDESEALREQVIDEVADSEEVPAPAPLERTTIENGDSTDANVEKVLVEDTTVERCGSESTAADSEKQDEQGDVFISKTEQQHEEENEATVQDSGEAAPKEVCISEQPNTEVMYAEEGTLEDKSELTASNVSREMDMSDSQHQDSVSGEETKYEESRELEAQVFPVVSTEIPENKENESAMEGLELSSAAEVTKSEEVAQISDDAEDQEHRPNEVSDAVLKEELTSETELPEIVHETTDAIGLTEEHDDKDNAAEDTREVTVHTDVKMEPSSPAEILEESCSEVETNVAPVPEVVVSESISSTSRVEEEGNDICSPDDTVYPETQERDIEQEAVLEAQVSESAEEVTASETASENKIPEAPLPEKVEKTFEQPEECTVADGQIDEVLSEALKDGEFDEVSNSEDVPAPTPVVRETIEEGDSTEANVEKVLVDVVEDSEKQEILEQGDISISETKKEYAEEVEVTVQDAPREDCISEQPSTEETSEDKSELTVSSVSRELDLSDSQHEDSVSDEETKYEESRELEAQTDIPESIENESATLVDEEKATENESRKLEEKVFPSVFTENADEERAVEGLELSSESEVTKSEEAVPIADDADVITDQECLPNEVDDTELQEVPALEPELPESVLETTGDIRLTEEHDDKENAAENAKEAQVHTDVDIETSSPAEEIEEKCSEEKEVETNAAVVPEVEAGDSLGATSQVEDEVNDICSPEDQIPEAHLPEKVEVRQPEEITASVTSVVEIIEKTESIPENEQLGTAAMDVVRSTEEEHDDDTEKVDGTDKEVKVHHDIDLEAAIVTEAREEKCLEQADQAEAPDSEVEVKESLENRSFTDEVVNIQAHDETVAEVEEKDDEKAREIVSETRSRELSAETEDAHEQITPEGVTTSLEEKVFSEEVDDGKGKFDESEALKEQVIHEVAESEEVPAPFERATIEDGDDTEANVEKVLVEEITPERSERKYTTEGSEKQKIAEQGDFFVPKTEQEYAEESSIEAIPEVEGTFEDKSELTTSSVSREMDVFDSQNQDSVSREETKYEQSRELENDSAASVESTDVEEAIKSLEMSSASEVTKSEEAAQIAEKDAEADEGREDIVNECDTKGATDLSAEGAEVTELRADESTMEASTKDDESTVEGKDIALQETSNDEANREDAVSTEYDVAAVVDERPKDEKEEAPTSTYESSPKEEQVIHAVHEEQPFVSVEQPQVAVDATEEETVTEAVAEESEILELSSAAEVTKEDSVIEDDGQATKDTLHEEEAVKIDEKDVVEVRGSNFQESPELSPEAEVMRERCIEKAERIEDVVSAANEDAEAIPHAEDEERKTEYVETLSTIERSSKLTVEASETKITEQVEQDTETEDIPAGSKDAEVRSLITEEETTEVGKQYESAVEENDTVQEEISDKEGKSSTVPAEEGNLEKEVILTTEITSSHIAAVDAEELVEEKFSEATEIKSGEAEKDKAGNALEVNEMKREELLDGEIKSKATDTTSDEEEVIEKGCVIAEVSSASLSESFITEVVEGDKSMDEGFSSPVEETKEVQRVKKEIPEAVAACEERTVDSSDLVGSKTKEVSEQQDTEIKERHFELATGKLVAEEHSERIIEGTETVLNVVSTEEKQENFKLYPAVEGTTKDIYPENKQKDEKVVEEKTDTLEISTNELHNQEFLQEMVEKECTLDEGRAGSENDLVFVEMPETKKSSLHEEERKTVDEEVAELNVQGGKRGTEIGSILLEEKIFEKGGDPAREELSGFNREIKQDERTTAATVEEMIDTVIPIGKDIASLKLEETAAGTFGKPEKSIPEIPLPEHGGEEAVYTLAEKAALAETEAVPLSDVLKAQAIAKSQAATHVLETRADEVELAKAEEAKTDEEPDEHDEDEHRRPSPEQDTPVMVEASKDIDVKAHKRSHHLLSGVGSKVKHSISKVKKAITGKSSHSKTVSPKQGL